MKAQKWFEKVYPRGLVVYPEGSRKSMGNIAGNVEWHTQQTVETHQTCESGRVEQLGWKVEVTKLLTCYLWQPHAKQCLCKPAAQLVQESRSKPTWTPESFHHGMPSWGRNQGPYAQTASPRKVNSHFSGYVLGEIPSDFPWTRVQSPWHWLAHRFPHTLQQVPNT